MIGRVAVFGPFRPRSEVALLPKRTSGDARAYVNNCARAGGSRLHRQQRTSGDARAYIDNRPRAGTLASTSTTAHERGRSRLHPQPSASGTARATRDVGQEEA